MGALYNTSKADNIDFMYKLPLEAMGKAIDFNVKSIDSQYQQAALFNNELLKIKNLTPDDEIVKKYIDEKHAQTEELSNTLKANPLDWRKQTGTIRDLAANIDYDFNRGKIADIQANATAFAAADAKEKARVGLDADKGGITPVQYQAWTNYTLGNFKGTFDPVTGEKKSIGVEDLYANQDLLALTKKYIDGVKASSEKKTWDSVNGQWIVKHVIDGEEVSEDRIDQIALNTMLGDQNVLGYLNQGHKMGYLNGVYDDKGNFIPPIKEVPVLDKNGSPTGRVQKMLDMRSPLASAIAVARGREVYSKTSTETTRDANEFSKIEATGAQQRRTDQAKYDRENPKVQEDVVAYVTNAPMFKPGEFSMETFTGVINEYYKKNSHTPQEEVTFQNAVRAKAAIEEGARDALKKSGVSDADILELSPYAVELSNGLKPPGKSGIKSELWVEQTVPSGSGFSQGEIQRYVLSAKGKKIQALWDKNKGAEKDLAKAVENGNSIQVYNMPIAAGTKTGDVFTKTATVMAKSANSLLVDAKGKELNLHFDEKQGGGFGTNGSLNPFTSKSNNIPIKSMADLESYCKPIATVRGMTTGSMYTYQLDLEKLKAAGISIEDENGNSYNDVITAKYVGTDATELEDRALKEFAKNTPIVQSIISTSNKTLSNVYSQMTTPASVGYDVDIIPPGNDGNSKVTVKKDRQGNINGLYINFPSPDGGKTPAINMNYPLYALPDENGNAGPVTFEGVAAKVAEWTDLYNAKYYKYQQSLNGK